MLAIAWRDGVRNGKTDHGRSDPTATAQPAVAAAGRRSAQASVAHCSRSASTARMHRLAVAKAADSANPHPPACRIGPAQRRHLSDWNCYG